eukprot:11161281-Lingulodinium_polyedra.AAC.1
MVLADEELRRLEKAGPAEGQSVVAVLASAARESMAQIERRAYGDSGAAPSPEPALGATAEVA